MTLLEGIGDEVVYVIGFAVIFLIVLLAWYSTSVGDHPIFRASVLVIERRGPNVNNQSNQPRIINVITTAANQSVITTSSNVIPSNENVTFNSPQSAVVEDGQNESNNSDAGVIDSTSLSSAAAPINESGADSKETQLRNRFQPSVDKSNVEREKEETVESNTDSQSDQGAPNSDNASTEGNIRIRLVFLNDTQKLVEAKLDDRLGQFKQQHFSEALANQRLVRLIYNGQLLRSDQETLQFYGLSDNCVLHCHISSQRLPSAPQQYSSNSELDLSRLMLPLFGLILGLIWCCRMQYRQYFNAASTFALIGITGLFVISVFSVCVTARNRLQSRGNRNQ